MITINPITKSDDISVVKASLSNKYIGYGGKNSSTHLYSTQIDKKLVNCGCYIENDIIFVSIVGNNGNASVCNFHQNKTIEEVLLALDSGATILCDNREYILKNGYNEGEKRLLDTLEQAGDYLYDEIIREGIKIGRWTGKKLKIL